ncbi:hypothetical protein ACJMK2_010789 [Sinanodonta woodiana]|uniref:BED-type domain-containing protein n=1 Tax=Sinanodonta woodiana TaxID=1069815 RepID=A0ABD3VJI2_SINWO
MGKFSKVWAHAERLNDFYACCKLCELVLSAKGGNTSTLRKHLVGTHHIDVDKNDSTNSTPSIASFLVGKPNLSKARTLQIDRRIAAFIAQDGRPISIVNGEGFKSLINFLEQDYDIKSRTTTTALIKERYDEGVRKMLVKLETALYVAFTTDLWTSLQNIAYMCVTAHWIKLVWELESAILQTRETLERHTGQNISVRLSDCASEWNIPINKIAATVHDNGSNMNAAMNLLDDWPDQLCFVHTLQLAISTGLKVKSIARMLGASRRLSAHFKCSTVAAQALREKQKALQNNDTTTVSEVIIDCSTRWNSTLDMLERLIKLRWAIGAVLSDPQITVRSIASTFEVTDENWSLAEALIPILKPFKQVTVMSSGQNYPSISSVYVHLYIIMKNILDLKPDDAALIKECSVLNAAKAAVVDPRYKLVKFLKEAPRQEMYTAVRLELMAVVIPDPLNVSQTTDAITDKMDKPESKRQRLENVAENNIFDDLASLCAAVDNASSVDELSTYLSEIPLHVNGDILQYWRDNTPCYSRLAALAQKYLCIPATSVPSESAFSMAEHVVNRKRASLSPDTVDMLVFLKQKLENVLRTMIMYLMTMTDLHY